MADAYGLPTQDMTYGAGAGWLPFYNQRDQLLASLYGMQGGLGKGLLDTLGQWQQDPAAGPLGLSAFARYGGGAQNIAAGTNGAGIANPYGGIFDRLLQGLSQSVMNPGSPFNPANNGQYNTDAAKIDPNKAPMMTPESAAKAPNSASDLVSAWNAYHGPDEQKPMPQMAEGGGMVLGGQPHFITDSAGNPVAALTEDGKQEAVQGQGGVEVTPLDPVRHAAYLSSKRFGDVLGSMMGGLFPPKTNFLTGGMALFPKIPGSGVNSGDEGGTTTLPSIGGPSLTRQEQVGDYFHPTDSQPLPTEATAPDSATRLKGYAKLFGSALSAGNTAVDSDFLHQLNSGEAPRQLLSSQALGTLAPSQRANYFALLQQMGLGRPEDNLEKIRQFRPDTMI